MSSGLIFIDLETRSSCELKTEGGRRYAEHPSTELLTVAWIVNGEEFLWFPGVPSLPEGTTETLLPGVRLSFGPENPVPPGVLVAHNAEGFDRHVWPQKDREWIDTEPLARRIAMPGGIDKIGERLRGKGKDKAGKSRLLKFCRAGTKYPGAGDLARIGLYNLEDVRIMVALWEYIHERPKAPEMEDRVLHVHKRINNRGIRLDLNLCHKLADLSERAVVETVDTIRTLTNGALGSLEDLRSRDTVFAWIESQEAKVGKSLRKDTLETLFREHDDNIASEDQSGQEIRLTPLVRKVLMQRFSALKISGAKVLAAMGACHHGRLHDILVYFGAHTGRWAGRRVQPQNLPRPVKGFDTWKFLEDWKVPEGITLAEAVGSSVRGIFVPDDGYIFAAADYNAIELRGLGWLAKEDRILSYFREGRCPYSAMARKLFGRDPVDKKDPIRQVGKVVVLGCGYQLGARKMGDYALSQGIDLEEFGLTGTAVVEAFRDEFPAVAGFKNSRGFREGGIWKDLEYHAFQAVKRGRSEMFQYDGFDLMMSLPSGRKIHYCKAAIEEIQTEYGPKDAVVYTTPRGFRNSLYGGLLTENCLGGDTLVLTRRGWIPITEVSAVDIVWDGEEWVSTDGCTYKGEQEAGEWLGVQVTEDHLITDGKTWRPVIHGDEEFIRQCLRWAAGSADWSSVDHLTPTTKTPKFHAYATVNGGQKYQNEVFCGIRRTSAQRVHTDPQRPRGKDGSAKFFQTLRYGRFGPTDTHRLFRDAATLSARRILTMAGGEYPYTQNGEPIGTSSSRTSKLCRDGQSSGWTSTVQITTRATNPETSGLYRDLRTQETLAFPELLSTKGHGTLPQISTSSTYQSGAETPCTTILNKEKPRARLWNGTGKQKVYDLLNCGPNSRFTILTSRGPLVVHNCTQAVCRDLLAEALVRVEDAGIPVVLHVHDEIVAQVRDESEALKFAQLMAYAPKWAEGFPMSVECDTMPRYAKTSPKGWKSWTV